MLDSVADARDIAVAMAKSLLDGSRPSSEVKVLAVQQKPDGEFSEVTIYQATLENYRVAEAQARKNAATAGDGRHGARPARAAPPQRQRAPRDIKTIAVAMKKAVFGTSRRSWVAIGLVAAWCAIFYLMRQPAAPWAFDAPAAQSTLKVRTPMP